MKDFRLKAMLLLLCLASVNISAIANSFGVKRGHSITYKFTYVGELPPISPPPIDWLRFEFLSVEETMAYIRVTIKFVDSTEETHLTATVDLFYANWMHTGFVIPANSKIGDTVLVEGMFRARDPPLQATIKGEETRIYFGVNRTVVYANYTVNDGPHKVYWDKQAGVLVEGIYHTHASEHTWTTIVEVTGTNMWVHDLQFLGLERWKWVTIIVVVAGAAVTAITLILRGRKPLEGEPLLSSPRALEMAK